MDAIIVTSRNPDITQLSVPSRSRPGEFHTVKIHKDGTVTCDCPGVHWRGNCHHIDEVRQGRVRIRTGESVTPPRREGLASEVDQHGSNNPSIRWGN